MWIFELIQVEEEKKKKNETPKENWCKLNAIYAERECLARTCMRRCAVGVGLWTLHSVEWISIYLFDTRTHHT